MLGFGWDDLKHPWSRNSKPHSLDESAKHLKVTIKEEGKRDTPDAPPVPASNRKTLPTFGTVAADIVMIDEEQQFNEELMMEQAKVRHQQREDDGLEDIVESMQPIQQPKVDNTLVGKRLEICWKFDLDEGGDVLRWCPGVVVKVSDGNNMMKKHAYYKPGEAVMFKFDAIEERKEEEHTWKVELKRSKWNPKNDHSHGCWRMDMSPYLNNVHLQ